MELDDKGAVVVKGDPGDSRTWHIKAAELIGQGKIDETERICRGRFAFNIPGRGTTSRLN